MRLHRYATAILCGVLLIGGAARAQDNRFRPRTPEEKTFGKTPTSRAIPDVERPPDLAEPPSDAIRLESGLAMKVLEPGRGGEPVKLNDKIDVHYDAWFADGEMYGTTAHLEKPLRQRVGQFMEGLQQAVAHMTQGEKRRIWIPAALTLAPMMPDETPRDIVFDLRVVHIFRAPPTPDDVAAVPQGAQLTDSGLAYRILEPGDGGENPSDKSAVRVDYSSWYMDGRLYDSSVLDSRPITFKLDATVPAFAEVIPQMTRGAKWRLWVPPELSNFEDQHRIAEMLVFDVELLGFMDPPITPPNVTLVAEDAIRDEMGLAYKIVRPGTGTRHPDYGDTVKVIYAGWTRDGKMFDSAYDHGMPATMEIDDRWPVGWNESLRGMVEGEKRIVWIPKELAYGDRPDRPSGRLTFEIELLSIVD